MSIAVCFVQNKKRCYKVILFIVCVVVSQVCLFVCVTVFWFPFQFRFSLRKNGYHLVTNSHRYIQYMIKVYVLL